MALDLASYSRGSLKYQCYQELFEKEACGEIGMLSSCSRRYTSESQLLDAGLMRCQLHGLSEY